MPFVKHKTDNIVKGGLQKKLYKRALAIKETEKTILEELENKLIVEKGLNTFESEEDKDAFVLNFYDKEFKAKTALLKERYNNGESLDSLLHDAYAISAAAAKTFIKLDPYPVQLMGAMVIHGGNIAEMKTGEGKTLTAVMPAYLNALPGKGVHIVTVNEYLAGREANGEIGDLFRHLGLTVGLNLRELEPPQKREAYNCDIMYIA